MDDHESKESLATSKERLEYKMSKGSSPRPYSVSQEEFGNNFDRIFGKKAMTPRVQENKEDIGSCGCGRSPDGKCCGWHGLTEDQYKEALEKYNRQQNNKQ
jgi:hypothetical protein